MLNIPTYTQYRGETKIALMDNSTIAFMEQMEHCGDSAKELLRGHDVIFMLSLQKEKRVIFTR